MKRYALKSAVFAALLIFFTTGCSMLPPENHTPGPTSVAVHTQTPAPTPTPAPVQKPSPAPAQTPTPSPTASPRSEGLNGSLLSGLSNEKLAWWFVPNTQHKPTTTDAKYIGLLKKANGIFQGDTSGKKIWLTFDEGYENGYTGKILDTLKVTGVKAMFFLTGPYVKQNPELVRRMIQEGHQIGNHTVNHPSLPTVSDAQFVKELMDLHKEVRQTFGVEMKFIRPPMGEFSEKTLMAAQQLGYRSVFWSYAYKDYDVNDQKGATNAVKVVTGNLHPGEVALLHAVSKDNAEGLAEIIKTAKEMGYEFQPFDF